MVVKKKFVLNRTTMIIGGGVLILLIITPSFYFYRQYKNTQKLLANPNLQAQEDVQQLVKKISQLILLPSEEIPTLATVSDIKKLANMSFFKNALNGDKVLIYNTAKKAYLYRPSINKIIEVSTLNISDNQPLTASSSSKVSITPIPSSSVDTKINIKLAIYNGTQITGLAKSTEKKITDKWPNIQVVKIADALGKNYSKTLVVDLSNKNKSFAAQLASFLNGTTGSLPKDETAPNADILVIMGGK
jgi:hypothetical protein